MYKIVAADSRYPRDGRFIEAIGQYKPLENPPMIEINEDRAMYWLQVGAQPSDTVRSLLSKNGLMLKLHLTRKGKSEAEIASELEQWREERNAKAGSKLSRKERKAQAQKEAEAKAQAEAAKAQPEPAAEEAPAKDAPAEEAAES